MPGTFSIKKKDLKPGKYNIGVMIAGGDKIEGFKWTKKKFKIY